MKSHLRWLFSLFFAIALVSCQDDLNINAPVEQGTSLFKGTPVIENLTTDLQVTGSKILVSGAGTDDGNNGTGTINLTVPNGVVIKNVFLYWESRHYTGSTLINTGDPEIKVNGSAVSGILIGKSNQTPISKGLSYCYRADVTNRGFVSTGANSLSITDFFHSTNDRPDGVGLLVVIDDGTNSFVEIRDGNDFAFLNFSASYPQVRFTNPQTFNFAPFTFDRIGEISMFVGDIGVENGIVRPHSLKITVGSNPPITIYKPFSNSDGFQWDSYQIPVFIPAGVTSVTVQTFSEPNEPSPFSQAASFAWVTAALTLPSPLGQIGDKVWNDLNKDGIQDNNEPGIPGVTVELYDCNTPANLLGTKITDPNGNYLFTDLGPGDYKVKFAAPSGYVFTAQNIGLNDEIDSDADPATGITDCFTLGTGVTDLKWDAGLYLQTAGIGDRVWEDKNQNGIQDNGEPGVPGVTVELYNCNSLNSPIATTTTDPSGLYSFIGLTPGCYKVKFIAQGRTFTSPNVGANDEVDSDADPLTGFSPDINLAAGQFDPTWDAGLLPLLGSLGDRVWEDLNQNGIQDNGEPGTPGITVNLYKCSSPAVIFATTTTGVNGIYLFSDLTADCYRIEFVAPGRVFTIQNVGLDDAVDSDVNPANGFTGDINLASAQVDLTWDAGLLPLLGKLGDRVWNDVNYNGIQDIGEVGIPNVGINLYADCVSTTNPIATTTTDALGMYLFENLPAGNYRMKFAVPTGFTFTLANIGADDAVDSDAEAGGFTACIDLGIGEIDLTWDAGFVQYASIGNFVWNDVNKNGIQDNGEPGMPNLKVELYDCSEPPVKIKEMFTGADGIYRFTTLKPGDYRIKFFTPAEYTFTLKDVGADDFVDSDADLGTGFTDCTNLSPGEYDKTWDAGMYQVTSKLGDRVWEDVNQNGIQDNGEPGVAAITVNLYKCNDLNTVFMTTVTDANGYYAFEDLLADCYVVKFVAPGRVFTSQNTGANDEIDSDADPTTGSTGNINLASGQIDLSWDAGLLPVLGSLGDRVWEDINGNGIQDNGEPGITGLTVNLFKCTNLAVPFKTTTTGINGLYLFSDLPADCYKIVFVAPGRTFTIQDAGANDEVDSDADPANGMTVDINLAAGQNDLSWDAGILPLLGSIGDRVWRDDKDLNCNGIQDLGEGGVSGVTVELYKCSNPNVVFKTTVTNGNGEYLFTELPADCYVVKVLLPTGYEFAPQNQGGDDQKDSDVNPVTGLTANINLAAGQNDLSQDAGLCPKLGSIGDRVWRDDKDNNCNGIQDLGEGGVSGVTVELYKCSNPNVAYKTTITNGNGEYLFTDLPEDCYFVKVLLPAEYEFAPQNQGGDDQNDSDVNPVTGQTANINLAAGQNDLSQDAGLCPKLGSIGDRVWRDDKDNNCNGIQDLGEAGVSGVTVELYKCSNPNVVFKTTVTNGNGEYLFTDLPADCYTVKVVLPAGYEFSAQNQGGDDQKDSDVNPVTGVTANINLGAGENDLSQDAGLCPLLSSLGDRVWNDLNKNGIQDAGEPGITNVTVQLFKCSNLLVPYKTTTTGLNGIYYFADLPADCYIVKFVAPVGYNFTLSNVGDDTKDSDANPATGFTSNITLPAGVDDMTWDAGLIAPEPCAPCKGGVTEITIKQLVPGVVTFSNLSTNDVVTANPPYYNIKNKIGARIGLTNDIGVYINGTLNTMLHMSCSQPVDPGFVYGKFEITYARSKDGGPVCPPDCSFQEVEFKFDKDKIKWKIKNTGKGSLVIKEIYITWPQANNGQLEKIKLNGDAFVGLRSSPLSIGENDWTGSLKTRWIKPGETKTLEFDFKKNVLKDPSKYTIKVVFYGTDCELEYDPTPSGGTNCTSRITATLLKYTGPDRGVVTVKFQGKDGGLATYTNVNLTNGTILQTGDWTVSALPNSLGTVMSIYINGVLHEAHHTSCSAPYAVGIPAPLDASSPGNPPKGTPSTNWLIMNFRDVDDI